MDATQPGNRTAAQRLAAYFRGFLVLRDTAPNFWPIQLIKTLEHAAQYALSAILTVYISKDFGLTDDRAGYALAVFGLLVSCSLWLSGFLTDWLGIRRSLVLALSGLTLLRGTIAVMGLSHHPHRGVVAITALFVLAPFMAMTVTLFQSAIRRYTTPQSRGAGFNLSYVLMNLGYVAGGLAIDLIRRVLGWPDSFIPLFGVATGLACLSLTFVIMRPDDAAHAADGAAERAGAARWSDRALQMLGVFVQPAFYRLLLLIVLLLGVRSIYTYQIALFPKFWARVIGPDAWIGSLQAYGPALTAIGGLLFIPLLPRFRTLDMLLVGSLISSLSLFVLAIPAYGPTTYVTTCAALTVLTFGELLWSPRLNEYAASIAPVGHEGTYLGLSLLPTYFAKLVVNLCSGYMLMRWIPPSEPGTPLLRDRLAAGEIPFISSPSMLWLMLGAIAIVGPLIAIATRRYFARETPRADVSAAT